jgi:hypothetical protein
MTLILTVNGPETIWMCADRRISYNRGCYDDEATKILSLEATDGFAFLGYAGLGSTAHGTQPSDWMSSVLRGINQPLESLLKILADAATEQLPKHLRQLPGNGASNHGIVIPAFVHGKARLYMLRLVFDADKQSFQTLTQRFVIPVRKVLKPHSVAFDGSGGAVLIRNREWSRLLLHLVYAHDNFRISAAAVADRMAAINYEVSQKIADGSVGPKCIVAWHYKKEGRREGGGGHYYYNGLKREDEVQPLPSLSRGLDIKATISTIFSAFTPRVSARINKRGSIRNKPSTDGIALEIGA